MKREIITAALCAALLSPMVLPARPAEISPVVKVNQLKVQYVQEWRPNATVPLNSDLQAYVHFISDYYSVPEALILGIIDVESAFQKNAYSGTCWGLMQIHEINYQWLWNDYHIDAETYKGNIAAGTLIISQLLAKYGNEHLALMAYNCGEAGAQELWNEGIYSTSYSWNVLDAAEYWKS